MTFRRIELEQQSGKFVAGRVAERLLDAGRARLSAKGRLVLLPGAPGVEEIADRRLWWTECSGPGARHGMGFQMNGKAINHGA
ncbi:MAG: hypothetical protein ACRD04_09300 [Terriglobales bacterium]